MLMDSVVSCLCRVSNRSMTSAEEGAGPSVARATGQAGTKVGMRDVEYCQDGPRRELQDGQRKGIGRTAGRRRGQTHHCADPSYQSCPSRPQDWSRCSPLATTSSSLLLSWRLPKARLR